MTPVLYAETHHVVDRKGPRDRAAVTPARKPPTGSAARAAIHAPDAITVPRTPGRHAGMSLRTGVTPTATLPATSRR